MKSAKTTTSPKTSIIARLTLLAVLLGLVFPVLAAADSLRMTRSGEDQAFLPVKPWSGYWWSRKEGKLVKGWDGQEAPFKKYDRFVTVRTGQNPGAHAWEADPRNGHYDPQGPGWAGHCNGWAAAALLEPEPRQARILDGISFTTADQKALLSESYMDCVSLFYGKRKNDNLPFSMDIYPDVFHRLLVENIKMKKRGLVADTSFTRSVWNYPIYGYETEWSKKWFIPNTLFVTTTVYFADDGVKPEFVGCKTFSKTYHYLLRVNGRGEVTGGVWDPRSIFDHPDFVWIPTADGPSQGGENPRLNPQFVHEITGRSAPNRMFAESAAVSAESVSPDMVLLEAGVNPEEYFQ